MKVPKVTLDHSWFEGKPKKIKGHILHLEWRVLLLVAFAIHNITLAVFYLKFTLLKSGLYRFQCPQGLFEVLAMDDYIIGIPLKLYFGVGLLDPLIKNNVQKDICQ